MNNKTTNKSKEQVQKYLSFYRKFKSEKDFLFISSLCKDTFGVRMNTPDQYSEDGLTSDQFYEWLQNGYGAGDVVCLEENQEENQENLGIVLNDYGDHVGICFRIAFNCPYSDYITVDKQSIHPAGENGLNRMKMALRENNLEFGNPNLVLTQKYVPKNDTPVSFDSLVDCSSGGGVVKCIDEAGNVYMHCYYIDGGDVCYDGPLLLGNVYDFIFRPSSTSDYARKKLETELNKEGMHWNHSRRRLEPNDLRNADKPYYYISDKLEILKKDDNSSSLASKRYSAGNYFMSREDAEKVLESVLEAIRKVYMKPSRKS